METRQMQTFFDKTFCFKKSDGSFFWVPPTLPKKTEPSPREIKKDYVCFCVEYADTYGMKPVLILSKTSM